MPTFDRVAEGIARGINRRTFLKKTASGVFAGVATFTVTGIRAPRALASHGTCPNPNYFDCSCHPPGSNWCSSSLCVGAACNSSAGCSYNTDSYADGCWCTQECCFNDGRITGYYMCCDCDCPGVTCLCWSFTTTCSSRPDEGPPCC